MARNDLRPVRGLLGFALCFAAFGGASAQTLGGTVARFNLLAQTKMNLKGFSASRRLTVPVVGTSQGTSLKLDKAEIGVYHNNDITAKNGQAEAQTLHDSLTAPAGAVIVNSTGTALPAALFAGPGITISHFNASVANSGGELAVTGTPTSRVIFQIPGALSLTNFNVALAGGLAERNVFWQVGAAITLVNDDAANRTFPGTAVNIAANAVIAVASSGAGSLSVGRLLSRGGEIKLTQSGSGMLAVANPAAAGPAPPGEAVPPGVADVCPREDFLFPSPATGASAQFAYCMAESGSVSIKAWNATGAIVDAVEEVKASGAQLSTLDTGRLAPGVYFFRIERLYDSGAVERSTTKKFVVKH